VSGIQCGGCGRFLANAHVIIGYNFDPYIRDVRGDCKRCGADVGASSEGDYCWWWQWESWDFDEVDIYAGAS
jgi:hypothetical protein